MDTYFLVMEALAVFFLVTLLGLACWKGCLNTTGFTLAWRPSNYQNRNNQQQDVAQNNQQQDVAQDLEDFEVEVEMVGMH